MLHSCETRGHSITEVGWGRISTELEDLLTSNDNEVHVIYQDWLSPKRNVRAAIPILDSALMNGDIELAATICIATQIDPANPPCYTKSGLKIVFRRDKNDFKPGKKNAKSTSFFRATDGVPESELRANWHKWETVRHASDTFTAQSLRDPVLDIHYVPRDKGRDTNSSGAIPYAMVITVRAPAIPNFYQKITEKYQILLPLQPKIQIPSPIPWKPHK